MNVPETSPLQAISKGVCLLDGIWLKNRCGSQVGNGAAKPYQLWVNSGPTPAAAAAIISTTMGA